MKIIFNSFKKANNIHPVSCAHMYSILEKYRGKRLLKIFSEQNGTGQTDSLKQNDISVLTHCNIPFSVGLKEQFALPFKNTVLILYVHLFYIMNPIDQKFQVKYFLYHMSPEILILWYIDSINHRKYKYSQLILNMNAQISCFS